MAGEAGVVAVAVAVDAACRIKDVAEAGITKVEGVAGKAAVVAGVAVGVAAGVAAGVVRTGATTTLVETEDLEHRVGTKDQTENAAAFRLHDLVLTIRATVLNRWKGA